MSKPLVVGSVGIEQLNNIFGTTARDDSDGWIGKRAVLYVDRNVVFGGKLTSGLRFKLLPGKRGPIEDMESDVPCNAMKCTDCQLAFEPQGTGQKLCWRCIWKMKKREEAALGCELDRLRDEVARLRAAQHKSNSILICCAS